MDGVKAKPIHVSQGPAATSNSKAWIADDIDSHIVVNKNSTNVCVVRDEDVEYLTVNDCRIRDRENRRLVREMQTTEDAMKCYEEIKNYAATYGVCILDNMTYTQFSREFFGS